LRSQHQPPAAYRFIECGGGLTRYGKQPKREALHGSTPVIFSANRDELAVPGASNAPELIFKRYW
jgi:hypothetical protein